MQAFIGQEYAIPGRAMAYMATEGTAPIQRAGFIASRKPSRMSLRLSAPWFGAHLPEKAPGGSIQRFSFIVKPFQKETRR